MELQWSRSLYEFALFRSYDGEAELMMRMLLRLLADDAFDRRLLFTSFSWTSGVSIVEQLTCVVLEDIQVCLYVQFAAFAEAFAEASAPTVLLGEILNLATVQP